MNAKERAEEAGFLGEMATPKSERRRSSYGSLLMSVQTSSGLCSKSRKCVKKDGHTSECWPKEEN